MRDGDGIGTAGIGLWEVAALFLPHSAGVALLAVVVLAMLGVVGKGAGAFHLFRDDDEVFGRDADFFDGAGAFLSRAVPRFGAACAANGPSAGSGGAAPSGLQLLLASPAFWSGAGLAASVGLLWMLVFTGPAPVRGTAPLWLGPGPGAGGLTALCVVLALSVLGSGAISLRHMRQPRSDRRAWSALRKWVEPGRALLGGTLGGMAVLLGHYLSVHLLAPALLGTGLSAEVAIWLAVALPWAVGVAGVFLRPNALACVSIFTLVVALMLVFGLIVALAAAMAMPRGSAVLVLVVLLGWLWVTNGKRQKYRLPGFAALYQAPEAPQDGHQGRAGHLIAPLDALKAWRANLRTEPGQKPILVLFATSGGAYRATFWTALLMDRLIGDSGRDGAWPGLADNVRVLTGASGGMVAAGYFAALAADRRLEDGVTATLVRDTHDSLAKDCARKFPIGRDSLSPIVHQMVRGDLWHSFSPRTPRTDRGQVLERQWRTIHFRDSDPDRGNLTFADLRPREENGTAPSLIFSPMLVETGALALMSNLDLGALRRRSTRLIDTPDAVMDSSVEVLKQFAGAQESVAIAQAARLSATFPYMSPAVSLPTDPDRRVVDAGYYDNYGVDLASGLLQDPEVADWINTHCAGVAVIEARAFPSPLPSAPAGRLGRAVQFATSPPEALFSARQASQVFRNHQQLHAAARLYPRDFLRVFTFEAVSDVSMSWYLRFDEVIALARLLEPPEDGHAAAMDRARTWLGKHSAQGMMGFLQARGGKMRAEARTHQIVLQRHVVDAELRALRAFWADPAGPDPRCRSDPADPVRHRAEAYPPNWFVAAQTMAQAGKADPAAG